MQRVGTLLVYFLMFDKLLVSMFRGENPTAIPGLIDGVGGSGQRELELLLASPGCRGRSRDCIGPCTWRINLKGACVCAPIYIYI